MMIDSNTQTLIGFGVLIFLCYAGSALSRFARAYTRVLLAKHNLADDDED